MVRRGDRDQDRSRAWQFTLNNYLPHQVEHLKCLAGIRYLCFGKEIGAEGTPHLQGYVHFRHAKSFASVKNALPHGCHIEAAIADAVTNRSYCKKNRREGRVIDPPELENTGDNWYEDGEPPVSCKRKGELEQERWQQAKLAAIAGDFDSVPPDIYFKHYRTMKAIHKDNMKAPPDLDGVCGIWIYGEAGCGKSRYAHETYPEAYPKMANRWWDGYQGQEVVLLEDFDPNHACLRHHMKIWCDRFAFIGEDKGGAVIIRPKLFVVTSQYSIEDIFKTKDGQPDQESISAVRRRCQVIHFSYGTFNPYGLLRPE